MISDSQPGNLGSNPTGCFREYSDRFLELHFVTGFARKTITTCTWTAGVQSVFFCACQMMVVRIMCPWIWQMSQYFYVTVKLVHQTTSSVFKIDWWYLAYVIFMDCRRARPIFCSCQMILVRVMCPWTWQVSQYFYVTVCKLVHQITSINFKDTWPWLFTWTAGMRDIFFVRVKWCWSELCALELGK